jgi:hypothetical protein
MYDSPSRSPCTYHACAREHALHTAKPIPWGLSTSQVYPVWSVVGPVYGLWMALLAAHVMALLAAHVIDLIRQNSLTRVIGLAHLPIQSTSLAPIVCRHVRINFAHHFFFNRILFSLKYIREPQMGHISY